MWNPLARILKHFKRGEGMNDHIRSMVFKISCYQVYFIFIWRRRKGDQNSGHHRFWRHTWPFILPRIENSNSFSPAPPFLWFISLIYFKRMKDNILKVQNLAYQRYFAVLNLLSHIQVLYWPSSVDTEYPEAAGILMSQKRQHFSIYTCMAGFKMFFPFISFFLLSCMRKDCIFLAVAWGADQN